MGGDVDFLTLGSLSWCHDLVSVSACQELGWWAKKVWSRGDSLRLPKNSLNLGNF